MTGLPQVPKERSKQLLLESKPARTLQTPFKLKIREPPDARNFSWP